MEREEKDNMENTSQPKSKMLTYAQYRNNIKIKYEMEIKALDNELYEHKLDCSGCYWEGRCNRNMYEYNYEPEDMMVCDDFYDYEEKLDDEEYINAVIENNRNEFLSDYIQLMDEWE